MKKAKKFKTNFNKTKLMVLSIIDIPHYRINPNEENVEQVTEFEYLVNKIHKGWNPEQEMSYRIEHAETTFLRLREFLTEKN